MQRAFVHSAALVGMGADVAGDLGLEPAMVRALMVEA